jgi:hypothetical protein
MEKFRFCFKKFWNTSKRFGMDSQFGLHVNVLLSISKILEHIILFWFRFTFFG